MFETNLCEGSPLKTVSISDRLHRYKHLWSPHLFGSTWTLYDSLNQALSSIIIRNIDESSSYIVTQRKPETVYRVSEQPDVILGRFQLLSQSISVFCRCVLTQVVPRGRCLPWLSSWRTLVIVGQHLRLPRYLQEQMCHDCFVTYEDVLHPNVILILLNINTQLKTGTSVRLAFIYSQKKRSLEKMRSKCRYWTWGMKYNVKG